MQSEGAADEARKEGSGGDTHSMIGTQEAVARVCGTKTNGTEPTNDSGYVEQVRVDNVVRQEVEFESGDAGMGRHREFNLRAPNLSGLLFSVAKLLYLNY